MPPALYLLLSTLLLVRSLTLTRRNSIWSHAIVLNWPLPRFLISCRIYCTWRSAGKCSECSEDTELLTCFTRRGFVLPSVLNSNRSLLPSHIKAVFFLTTEIFVNVLFEISEITYTWITLFSLFYNIEGHNFYLSGPIWLPWLCEGICGTL